MHSLTRALLPLAKQPQVTRLIHTTGTLSLDLKWRRLVGRPDDARQDPELADGLDYSFLDGRPTPIGQLGLAKYEDEKRLAAQAVKCLNEVHWAVQRQEVIREEEELRAQAILSRKLKPKGVLYKSKTKKNEVV